MVSQPIALPPRPGEAQYPWILRSNLTLVTAPGWPLRAELIADTARLAELRDEWTALHQATGATNPFTAWPWVYHWWCSFARHKGLVLDRLRVVALRDRAGVVRVILPFVLTEGRKGPLHLRLLRLYGFGAGGLLEIRAPLVWPGWEREAVTALANLLSHWRYQYHWCFLDGLPADGMLAEQLGHYAAACGWHPSRPLDDFVLPLAPSWEAFRGGLRRNIKESLRKCYNSLKRAGHAPTFELVLPGPGFAAALDEFFSLHHARATTPNSIRHPDLFRLPQRRAFIRHLAADLPPGTLAIARLRVDGAVVASRLLLRAGDTLYLYYSGYDPVWAGYSVMTTLTAECIKWAIAQGFGAVNLSCGSDVSKLRWAPDTVVYHGYSFAAPTAAGHVFGPMLASRLHYQE